MVVGIVSLAGDAVVIAVIDGNVRQFISKVVASMVLEVGTN